MEIGEIEMSHKRMYRPGRAYRCFDRLLRDIYAGHYVYMYGRLQHPGWVRCMQLDTVVRMFNRLGIRKAIRND